MITQHNDKIIAVIEKSEARITDVGSALDLMASVRYQAECDRIVISKDAVAEEFFVLSSGLAGEILQKFINYQMKLAIYGDYSHYTSKPLHDFIYESNNGKDIFFAKDLPEALKLISKD